MIATFILVRLVGDETDHGSDLKEGYFISIQQLHQSGKVHIFWKDENIFEGAKTASVAGHIL